MAGLKPNLYNNTSLCGGMVDTLVLETSSERSASSTLVKGT